MVIAMGEQPSTSGAGPSAMDAITADKAKLFEYTIYALDRDGVATKAGLKKQIKDLGTADARITFLLQSKDGAKVTVEVHFLQLISLLPRYLIGRSNCERRRFGTRSRTLNIGEIM